jgi:hypothetical protein
MDRVCKMHRRNELDIMWHPVNLKSGNQLGDKLRWENNVEMTK